MTPAQRKRFDRAHRISTRNWNLAMETPYGTPKSRRLFAQFEHWRDTAHWLRTLARHGRATANAEYTAPCNRHK